MTDLAAIRARAEQYPEPPERADDLDLPWLLWGAADRRTLLAEVDRLADELDGMTDTALDMARKYRQWRPPGSQAQRESAIAAERARIAEAVNRIPPGEFVRAAVLDAIGDDR